MIDMGDITRVQQRIAQLQKSFMGLQQVPGAVGFDAQLQQAIAAQKAAEAAKGQASGANAAQARKNGYIADLAITYHLDITKSWTRITFRGS